MDLTEKSERLSLIEADGHLALGELELKFATDLLDWLCRKRVIGSITRRAALMALMPPPTAARLADGRSRPRTGGPLR